VITFHESDVQNEVSGKVTKVVEKWSFFSKKSSFLGIYFYFVLSFLEVVFDPVSR